MQYEDSDPENQEFVAEIRRREDFNNMLGNLPQGFYRRMPDRIVDKFPRVREMWSSIDAFILETGFDEDEYWRAFNEGYTDPGRREESQIMLCPMYVYLRKESFSGKDITS